MQAAWVQKSDCLSFPFLVSRWRLPRRYLRKGPLKRRGSSRRGQTGVTKVSRSPVSRRCLRHKEDLCGVTVYTGHPHPVARVSAREHVKMQVSKPLHQFHTDNPVYLSGAWEFAFWTGSHPPPKYWASLWSLDHTHFGPSISVSTEGRQNNANYRAWCCSERDPGSYFHGLLLVMWTRTAVWPHWVFLI